MAIRAPRAPDQDILLDTSLGRAIPNAQARTIQHPLAAKALEESITFPSALRLATDPQYNCHGLTLAGRRAGVHEDAEVTRVLQEDGFAVIEREHVLPGDLAIYYSDTGIDHSALVVTKPEAPGYIPFVVSKWGVFGPEVFHLATTTPGYSTSRIIYYRQDPQRASATND